MSRGMYAAASAMVADAERFEAISNNLANVNTHGYKRQQTVHHDFEYGLLKRIHAQSMRVESDAQGQPERRYVPSSDQKIGVLGTGTMTIESWTDFDNGSLETTEGKLDLALQGDGFYALSTEAGQTLYTRNGAFVLDAEGLMRTPAGLLLLDQNGEAIQLSGVNQVDVGRDGTIFGDGVAIAQIQRVRFETPQLLLNRGQNLYEALPQQAVLPADTSVHQGYLERANVDVAGEMVLMISALRSYQVSQKAMQTEDDMTGKLVNEVGRLT